MTRRVLLACALLVSIACGGPSPERSPTATPSGSPSPDAGVRSRLLVLRADLSAKVHGWRQVLFVPFGKGNEQLALEAGSQGGPVGPSSFAVSRDVVEWRGRIYVLEDDDPGRLASAPIEGEIVRTAVSYRRRPLFVTSLIPSPDGLLAAVGGYVERVSAGPKGLALLSPDSGEIEPVRGVPVASGSSIALETTADQELEVRFERDAEVLVQPIRVELSTSLDPGSKELPAVVGPGDPVAAGDGVAFHVQIAPSRPEAGARYGTSRWLLRTGTDMSPVVWERLPGPTTQDEYQGRHLAAGPDGALYLMAASEEGIRIYRRERGKP